MAAYDQNKDRQNKNPELSEPADYAVAVTPNDTQTDLAVYGRALYVGTGGNVKVMMKKADMVADLDANGTIYPNVQAGTVLPIQFRRVIATGTTASNMVALVTK